MPNSYSPDPPIKNRPNEVRLPLYIFSALALGMLLGAWLFGGKMPGMSGEVEGNAGKLKEVLSYINRYYVDTVKVQELAEVGIEAMLNKLDPHSVYIAAKDYEMANAPLEGSFVGVGIEYNIFKDTLNIMATISGGPAEKAGLIGGDKIVEVDGVAVAGQKLESRAIADKLRGEEDSEVEVGVIRNGRSEPLKFKITRAKITTSTVEVAYMLDAQTGFIKVNRFGANTYQEFSDALVKLSGEGAKRLVIDIRDNGGGYLDKAIDMADDFLAEGDLIVYTQGRETAFNDRSMAKASGKFEKGPVIVLINESSASASEVFSGALQDQDRALIVGRRSFGKGLVQRPLMLRDGSALRLTISRYYTPSGRSIQRAYQQGHYTESLEERFTATGELFNVDSMRAKHGDAFSTLRLKRTVYGGGGIHPDVFVPLDTSFRSAYYQALVDKNLIREYALNYTTQHKQELEAMGMDKYIAQFDAQIMMAGFIDFAIKSGVARQEDGLKQCEKRLVLELKANVARNVWQEKGFYPIYRVLDADLEEALKHWQEAEELQK